MSENDEVSPVAAHVIRKCGGVKRTAEILGCPPNRVYKWTYPKGRNNGRGGLVPVKDQQALMAAAGRGEVDLTPADFFPQNPKEATHGDG